MTVGTQEASAFVSVENLSKRFGSEWALIRANLKVEAGKLALLTGSNGSGKTTLLRCLSTALTPDFGNGSVSGFDLVRHRDEVRRRIASLPQPVGFYGGLSARENLALTRSVLLLPESLAIDPLLERVGLTAKAHLPVDAFSSGMKQRFALARLALVNRQVILLDEPETHLDADGLGLLQVMISEWKARGAVVICATHSPDRFGRLADQEIRLSGGHPEERHASR